MTATDGLQIIRARIRDEYNGLYPEALVAAYAGAGYSELSFEADGIEEGADLGFRSSVESVTYKVNYWYEPENEKQGIPSRQLKEFRDGVLTDVLHVNLSRHEAVAIMDSALPLEEKILAVIKLDLLSRY